MLLITYAAEPTELFVAPLRQPMALTVSLTETVIEAPLEIAVPFVAAQLVFEVGVVPSIV